MTVLQHKNHRVIKGIPVKILLTGSKGRPGKAFQRLSRNIPSYSVLDNFKLKLYDLNEFRT